MSLNKSVVIAGGWLVLGLTGCSGGTDSPGSTINDGGAGGGGTGGTGFVLVGSGGGGAGGMAGSNGTAGGGGRAGTAGASGGTSVAGSGGSAGGTTSIPTGGSGGQGPAGTPGYPSGPVTMCFGPGCPYGECDNDTFFADVTCSSVYMGNVGAASSYCKAASSDSYCLVMDTFGPDYSVSCASGSATVTKCTSGCGSSGGSRYECTSF